MKDLLTLAEGKVEPSPYALTIPEFKSLSVNELAFVYFFVDHRSSYAAYEADERQNILLADLKMTAVNPKIQAAVSKYMLLSETHAIKLLKAARISVTKLQKYFETIDLTDMDENGRLIYQAKDLVANLSKMGDVVEGLDKLEELVKKQTEKDNPNRGGVVTNKYSE
jgi:hypothetical protein